MHRSTAVTKLMTAMLSIAMTATLSINTMAISIDTYRPKFTDVPADSVFYADIMACAELGVIGGYADNTFKPTKPVSRSNFAVMLSRCFYADDIDKYDTETNRAHSQFVPNYLALYHAHVLDDTSFGNKADLYDANVMTQHLNRYDMAQLIANIMKTQGLTVGDSQKQAAMSDISDYASIPEQYKDAVATVYAMGIIGGYAGGRFNGSVTMNRGQAAAVINRMLRYIETPEDTNIMPPVTDRTLSNGKPITAKNVIEILNQIKAEYPQNTNFANGYAGLISNRDATDNCIEQVTKVFMRAKDHTTRTDTTLGCGGWAAFVCDEIFGQTNVTWKLTTLENIRPGDLMIQTDIGGYLTHVAVYVGPEPGYDTTQVVNVTDASENERGQYVINWPKETILGQYWEVYTAYPD